VTPSPYPAPLACTEPSLGALATQALGQVQPATVTAHITTCLACQLQRVAFDELNTRAIPPQPDLRSQLRNVAQRRFRNP
jgi:hypothetical protein